MSDTVPATDNSKLKYQYRDRNKNPTGQASVNNSGLAKNGHDHGNGGQGSKQNDLDPEGSKFFSYKPVEGSIDVVRPRYAYNPENGGIKAARDSFAGWTKRMLGFDFARGENTYLYNLLGRAGLSDAAADIIEKYFHQDNIGEFIKYAQNNGKSLSPAILIPRNSWGLTAKIFKKAGFEVIEYDVDPADPSSSFKNALDTHSKTHVIAGAYFNTPHNATGMHHSTEHYKDIKAVLDAYNETAFYKVPFVLDIPYFDACRKNDDPSKGYLDTGIHGLFDLDDKDPTTPYYVSVSGSKFFRTAQEGFCALMTDAKTGKSIEKRIISNGHGMSWRRELLANIALGLSQENDHIWTAQFDDDRAAIDKNCGVLRQDFGIANSMDGLGVVPGGNNLIQLVRFKAEDYIGRVVTSFDGESAVIKDTVDILEFMDNFEGRGVVLVDGEEKKVPNTFMLRFSLAADEDTFSEKISGRAKEILKHIRECPHIDDLSAANQVALENAYGEKDQRAVLVPEL